MGHNCYLPLATDFNAPIFKPPRRTSFQLSFTFLHVGNMVETGHRLRSEEPISISHDHDIATGPHLLTLSMTLKHERPCTMTRPHSKYIKHSMSKARMHVHLPGPFYSRSLSSSTSVAFATRRLDCSLVDIYHSVL
jgi:hypothetical protein